MSAFPSIMVCKSVNLFFTQLTHEVPVLPSYRNQSIDLHSKSVDCFLYEGNTGTSWVNIKFKLDELSFLKT